MSQDADNVAIIKGGYEKWRTHREDGYEIWVSLCAPEIQWHSIVDGAPGMAFTDKKHGLENVRAYFEGLKADWTMIDYVPEIFIAQGDRVVMRGWCEWRHRHTGRAVRSPKADFFRMKDGKIVEFFEFFDSAAALAATQV